MSVNLKKDSPPFDFRTKQEKIDCEYETYLKSHPVAKLAKENGFSSSSLIAAVQAYGYLGTELRQEERVEIESVLPFVKKHNSKAKKTNYGFHIKAGWKQCFFTQKDSTWFCYLPAGAWGWNSEITLTIENPELLNLLISIAFEKEVLDETK